MVELWRKTAHRRGYRPVSFGWNGLNAALIEVLVEQRQQQPGQRYQRGDPGNGAEPEAPLDHHAAEPGADSVAKVECGNIEARRETLPSAIGFLQHPHLQRRHGGECREAEQADERDCRDLVVHGERHQREHGGEQEQAAEQSRHQLVVGKSAADEIAGHQARAEHQQDRRHRGILKPGNAGQDRRDIGEDREHADPAQHRGQQPDQHRAPAQHCEIVPQSGRFLRGGVAGNERRDHRQRSKTDHGHRPEGCAPAETLAEPGAEGNAEDVGDGQPGEHHGDGGRLLVGRNEAGRDNRADAEEGAVGECGQHPRRHQRPVVRRKRARRVADGEDRHQHQQRGFARPAAGGDGHDRRTEHDTEGVTGNQKARCGDRNAEIGADLDQQAHDDEFSDADSKGAGGERVKCEWHEGSPWKRARQLGKNAGPAPTPVTWTWDH